MARRMEKVIRVEYSQVSKEKWDDAKFLSDLVFRIKEIQLLLSAPTSIELASIHEAGHAIYWEKLGLTTRPVGPTISYNADLDRWDFHVATSASPSPTTLKANYQNLLAIAKSAAAGGAFVRYLLKEEDDAGATDDRYRFRKVCCILRENAQKQNKFLCFNERKIWDKAYDMVLTDLESSELQKEARERAQRIKHEWFEQ
jgi:hypothetical protein